MSLGYGPGSHSSKERFLVPVCFVSLREELLKARLPSPFPPLRPSGSQLRQDGFSFKEHKQCKPAWSKGESAVGLLECLVEAGGGQMLEAGLGCLARLWSSISLCLLLPHPSFSCLPWLPLTPWSAKGAEESCPRAPSSSLSLDPKFSYTELLTPGGGQACVIQNGCLCTTLGEVKVSCTSQRSGKPQEPGRTALPRASTGS